MKRILTALVVFLLFACANVSAQAYFNAYLLTPPPGPGCPGKVRLEYRTCTCWFSGGIWVTVNGGGLNFGTNPNCGGAIQHTDYDFNAGEYDFVATVNFNSECDEGQVFNVHVSVPNPSCGTLTPVYTVTQPSGIECNGTITLTGFSGTAVQCFGCNYVDISIINQNNAGPGGNLCGFNGNLTGGGAPGTYRIYTSGYPDGNGGTCPSTITPVVILANCCTTNAECNDGDACTADACVNTRCQRLPVNCDDNNECTIDECNSGTGCERVTRVCTDGNACTADGCDPVNGCFFGAPLACDDHDPCTRDGCNTGTGICAFDPVPAVSYFLDSDRDGYGNPDSIIPVPCGQTSSRPFSPNNEDCDDHNADVNPQAAERCNGIDDNCNGEVDEGLDCTCLKDADCDDADACTGTEICEQGTCAAGTPLDCDDGNTCTDDICDPLSGCPNLPGMRTVGDCCETVADCPDDEIECTVEVCENHQCSFEIDELCCSTDNDCPLADEGDVCLQYVCENQYCVLRSIPGCCISDQDCSDSDENDCLLAICDNSVCTTVTDPFCCSTDNDCPPTPDGIVCQEEVCNNHQCVLQRIEGCCSVNADCADDGNVCTEELCVDNLCVKNNKEMCCNISNDCPLWEVYRTCTTYECVSHQCEVTRIANCCQTNEDCEDGDNCTDGVCVINQCEYTNNACCHTTADCAILDDQPCVILECIEGLCLPRNIDGCCIDNIDCANLGEFDCTIGVCIDFTCEYHNIPDCCISALDCGTPTTLCLVLSGCVDNTCVYNSIPNCCVYEYECLDPDPCVETHCVDLVCEKSPKCDDQLLCTNDLCYRGGCIYSDKCADGNECTDDFCNNGNCSNPPKSCNDGIKCTIDGCNPETGCTNIQIECASSDPCTIADCNPHNGKCQFTKLHCNDHDACTDDICFNGGCAYNPKVCVDNDPCTTDNCRNGNCRFTYKCEDDNLCTIDICRNGVCSRTVNTCDDNKVCTEDECKNGVCKNKKIHGCSAKESEEYENEMQPGAAPGDESQQLSAYPNPFTNRLNIEFSLVENSRVQLEVFNISGQRVAVLFEGDVKAGELIKKEFNPATSCDCMYIYRLVTEKGAFFGKAVMIK